MISISPVLAYESPDYARPPGVSGPEVGLGTWRLPALFDDDVVINWLPPEPGRPAR